ncbi:pseudaminic acid cytidylyltransferase [Roseobacter litoralis]|uniref:pseudaminic acid cytidylyltransferase n=1 Tax=Roseobacter litoralis TaxID=42443 RepID=UPI00249477DE|nr:pseudaminic acid cytidylyltransferase [Roseobacter litoralis]
MARIAVIPARGGSKRLPRKNVALLNGQPLVAYSIEVAKASQLFSRVIVSTEDEEIAAIAAKHGAEIVMRPEHLADDQTPVVDVCLHALQTLAAKGKSPVSFCCIYATAVFLVPSDLVENEKKLTSSNAVMGVSAYPIHPFKALVETDGCLVPLWPEKNARKSQTFPNAFASNGTFYWRRTDDFLKSPGFYSDDLVGHLIPAQRAVDIDTMEDLKHARLLAKLNDQSCR